MPGIQTNAGVLEGGKLTQYTKDFYIEEIKKELVEGSKNNGFGFECGPQLQPSPDAKQYEQLHDPAIYPELHTTWVGYYEKIANALDINGNTPLLPICDITALAVMIDADLPDLTIDEIIQIIVTQPIMPKLKEILGPDIETKMPDIIGSLPVPPPIPQVPIPDPKLPDLGFDDQLKFSLELFKLPLKVFQAIIPGKLPELKPSLPDMIKVACDGVFDSLPAMKPSSDAQIAAANVLARHTGKMMTLTLTGSTFGNGALVKAQAAELGYTPPEEKPKEPPPEPTEDPQGLLDFRVDNNRLSDTSKEFRAELIKISKELDINPNFIAAAMTLETGGTYSASIVNPDSKAVGLIQFTGFAIQLFKKKLGIITSREELAKMTNVEQLDFVKKYYEIVQKERKVKTLGDAYLAVLAGGSIGKPPESIVFKSPDLNYKQNSGFDTAKKGTVTVGDVTSRISNIYEAAKKRGTI